MSAKRPSPSESATLFKIGTIKKGNDGNSWIISETANGIRRWKKHTDSNKTHVKIENDIITEFCLTSIKSIAKIGKLMTESNVVAGEFDFGPINGFPKFKKGTYYIYNVDDNLVLSKINLDKKQMVNTVWHYTGISVGVDSGSFGFWDLKYLKALTEFDMKTTKLHRKRAQSGIPGFFDIWTDANVNDTMFIKIKDLNDSEKYIDYGFDGNQIIGVISSTGTGDGVFGCYSNENNTALLLLGGNTAMTLYDNAEDLPPHLAVVDKYRKRTTSRKSRRGSRKISKKTSRKGNRRASRKNSKRASRKGNRRNSYRGG